MTITPIIAPHALDCFRCINLGIPSSNIAAGEECMEIEHEGVIGFSCMDCFDRLNLELEQ